MDKRARVNERTRVDKLLFNVKESRGCQQALWETRAARIEPKSAVKASWMTRQETSEPQPGGACGGPVVSFVSSESRVHLTECRTMDDSS